MSLRHLLNEFHAFVSAECIRHCSKGGHVGAVSAECILHCSKGGHVGAAWELFVQSDDTDWRHLHTILHVCFGNEDGSSCGPMKSLSATWLTIIEGIVDACKAAGKLLADSGIFTDVTSSFQRPFLMFCSRIAALTAFNSNIANEPAELFRAMLQCPELDWDHWVAVMPLVVHVARLDCSMSEQASQLLIDLRGQCLAAHASTKFNAALHFIQQYSHCSSATEICPLDQLLVHAGRMSKITSYAGEDCLYYKLATEYGSSPLMAALTIRGDWKKADALFRTVLLWATSGSSLAGLACCIYINNLQACVSSVCTQSARYRALDPDWADTACTGITCCGTIELCDADVPSSVCLAQPHLMLPLVETWMLALQNLPSLLHIIRGLPGMGPLALRLTRLAAFMCLEADFSPPYNFWHHPAFSSAVHDVLLALKEDSIYAETATRAMRQVNGSLQDTPNAGFVSRSMLLPPNATRSLLYACVLDCTAGLYDMLERLQHEVRSDSWGAAFLQAPPKHLQLFATCRSAFAQGQTLAKVPAVGRIVDAVGLLWQHSHSPVSIDDLRCRFPILDFLMPPTALRHNPTSHYRVWHEGAAASCRAYGLDSDPIDVALPAEMQERIDRTMNVAANVFAVVMNLLKQTCSTFDVFCAVISALDCSNTSCSKLRLMEASAFLSGLVCCLQMLGSVMYFCHCADSYWRVMSLATPPAHTIVDVPMPFASIFGDCENFARIMLETQETHDNCVSIGPITYLWKDDLQRFAKLTERYATDSATREELCFLQNSGTLASDTASLVASLRRMCLKQACANTLTSWSSSLGIECDARLVIPSANDAHLEWLQYWQQFVEYIWLFPSDAAIVKPELEAYIAQASVQAMRRPRAPPPYENRVPLRSAINSSPYVTPALLLAHPLLAPQSTVLEAPPSKLLGTSLVTVPCEGLVTDHEVMHRPSIQLRSQNLHCYHILSDSSSACEQPAQKIPFAGSPTSGETEVLTPPQTSEVLSAPCDRAEPVIPKVMPTSVIAIDLDERFEQVFGSLRGSGGFGQDLPEIISIAEHDVERTMDAHQPRFVGIQTYQLEVVPREQISYLLSTRQANLVRHIEELELQAHTVECQMAESKHTVQSLAASTLQRDTSKHLRELHTRANALLAETTTDTLLSFIT